MHPVIFQIGSFSIRSYGALVALAFLTASLLLYKESLRNNFYPDKILDLEFVILVSGIIGARILHVLVNMDYYSKNLLDILIIWRGGLAFYGSLILAMLASIVFIIRNKMPLLKTGDLIAPYIALGQSIGRIGCFFNGCCFGKPATAHIFGVSFPGEDIARIPVQILESLILFIIFFFLKTARTRNFSKGIVFFLYLFLYGLERFFMDFLRADNPTYLFGLTISQMISAIIVPIAAFITISLMLPRRVIKS